MSKDLKEELEKNKFTDNTTSYYLIQKRKDRANLIRQQYKNEMKAVKKIDPIKTI